VSEVVRLRRGRCEAKESKLVRPVPQAHSDAIQRACKNAGVPAWHPHQLRHNAAGRETFSLEPSARGFDPGQPHLWRVPPLDIGLVEHRPVRRLQAEGPLEIEQMGGRPFGVLLETVRRLRIELFPQSFLQPAGRDDPILQTRRHNQGQQVSPLLEAVAAIETRLVLKRLGGIDVDLSGMSLVGLRDNKRILGFLEPLGEHLL